jgi:hypothetical protein
LENTGLEVEIQKTSYAHWRVVASVIFADAA